MLSILFAIVLFAIVPVLLLHDVAGEIRHLKVEVTKDETGWARARWLLETATIVAIQEILWAATKVLPASTAFVKLLLSDANVR